MEFNLAQSDDGKWYVELRLTNTGRYPAQRCSPGFDSIEEAITGFAAVIRQSLKRYDPQQDWHYGKQS